MVYCKNWIWLIFLWLGFEPFTATNGQTVRLGNDVSTIERMKPGLVERM